MPGPGQPSRLALRVLTRVVRPLTRVLFRPSLHGLEHLPDHGPFMLVANHSAGVGLAEILCIGGLFAEAFGGTRRIAGFVHPINYTNPFTTWIQDQVGSIPSTYTAAESALSSGVSLLVFPGGDHETLRPIWQANRVDFNRRKGFLKIARRAGVPIVPMGISGSHWTSPILVRGKGLAWALGLPRLMGLKRWGVSLLAALLCVAVACSSLDWAWKLVLAWAALASPIGFVPFVPAKIRIRLGPALVPADLFRDDDPELNNAYDRVVGAVQAQVS